VNLADQTPRKEGRAGRPWQSRTEYLVDQALFAWSTDEEALRHMPPPGLPARPLFPPRTGFRSHQPGILDVLNIDRYQPSNKSWVSGFPVEYRHGERVYPQGEQSGQAGSRNSMGAMWI
jgi:hypothetical protein